MGTSFPVVYQLKKIKFFFYVASAYISNAC